MLILIALAGVPSYYFYNKYQTSQALLQNPTEATKVEIKTITAQIGKLMELPAGEEPTIATILDKEKLKDQPFYARSENGDKIIIYAQAKKAILYRPSTKKIIDTAPLNIDPPANPIKIALYNGTTSTGLTNDLEKELKEKVTNIEVVAKENAKKNDYARTLVIDLTGIKANEATQLAQFFKGEVSPLPAGEVKPEVSGQTIDMLVIIGKDYTPASATSEKPTPAKVPATMTPTANP